jgi:hypothetical protein
MATHGSEWDRVIEGRRATEAAIDGITPDGVAIPLTNVRARGETGSLNFDLVGGVTLQVGRDTMYLGDLPGEAPVILDALGKLYEEYMR